ncbi:DUF3574 domain-containing protein [Merismopedia glauca]|uniref:DUF3574 domain-containing protein n=1 Tax=Merismopedia glauca CCAP 1448/3 TaxID=1296344 RepID=A0A2T1C993_9CYAN|nr:DUF3574 domain-containing protein [Merismopedia glauca]PSB04717.1 DUF3574 domain-containing protein [Merismopedia glauca CCAP 1448/3]
MPVKLTSVITHSLIISGFAAIATSIPYTHASQGVEVWSQSSSLETNQPIDAERRRLCGNLASANLFVRTELFFGASRPNGLEVSETEFQTFLNREITPRFPDGLTFLAGRGQFRNSQGVIIKEKSRLIILLYPVEKAKDSTQRIEQIRRLYNNSFQQESVLRVDDLSCTSF